MGISTKDIDGVDFSLVSIHAANEIARFYKNLETNLENVNQLSELMLSKSFTDRLDYQHIFSTAYYNLHPEENYKSIEQNSKKHTLGIIQGLRSLEKLDKKQLKELTSFCVKLSNSASLYKEKINNLKGPCFG